MRARLSQRWQKVLATSLWVVSLVILILALMLIFEEKLIFFPERFPSGDWEAPTRDQIPVQDIFIQTDDGNQLHGWYLPVPENKGIILYFHGNAGNITHRWQWAKQLRSLQCNIFLLDYRGYGKSTGNPTVENLYKDSKRTYDYLTNTLNYPPGHIILYGESLGSAPACYLASQYPVGALILRSPFTNAKDMAAKILPLPFVPRMIRSRLPNDEYIQQARCPVLIIHAEDDHVIPFWQGERLFQRAPEPKEFLALPTGNHNTIEEKHGKYLIQEIHKFLQKTNTN